MAEGELHEPLFFHYNPQPEPLAKPAGVEQGWFVVWGGQPGPASIAKTGLLTEEDGLMHIVLMEDFQGCTVIDNREDGNP